MNKERVRFIAAVYVLFIKDQRVLLSLRQNTGYADGLYSLVAGHLEGNETATAGIQREIREEAGVDVSRAALRMRLVMHRFSLDRECFDFFFSADSWDGELRNNEPEKCGGLAFFDFEALPSNTAPYIRAALAAIRAGQTYMEYGWPETATSQIIAA